MTGYKEQQAQIRIPKALWEKIKALPGGSGRKKVVKILEEYIGRR